MRALAGALDYVSNESNLSFGQMLMILIEDQGRAVTERLLYPLGDFMCGRKVAAPILNIVSARCGRTAPRTSSLPSAISVCCHCGRAVCLFSGA